MSKWIVRFPLKVLGWSFALVGFAALLLTAMIATPLEGLPELTSISQSARAVDRSTMPPLTRFSARDGTALAFRHYPARGPSSGRIAVLVHGSSGSSVAVHALADALAGRGVETYAPDIRGHGGSGNRGDVGFIGQLENDLEDLVALIRKTSPSEPLTLLGHPRAAALRFASRVRRSRICLRAQCCLRPISVMTRRPTNPIPAAGLNPISRVFLPSRRCTGSASIVARRCRRWPLRCRQTPNVSSPRPIPTA